MGGFSGPDRHEEHVGPGQSARGDVAPRSLVRVRPAALPRLSLRWCDARGIAARARGVGRGRRRQDSEEARALPDELPDLMSGMHVISVLGT